ncbi:porin family protein [Riemerella anatipestifer]|nr:porin family protein [Riemerella anatipestifer]
MNSFDFSPFIGAEYNFSNGLFLDTRYNIGVTDLAKSKDDNIKSRLWQIGFGYKF